MKTSTKKRLFTKVLMTFLAAALILSSLIVLSACGEKGGDVSSTGTPSPSSVSSEAEKISITFKIIKDGETKEFAIKTDEKYLANALVDEGLVEYANDGYYNTIDGITADFSKDKSWWCVTVGGKSSMLGMNEIELKNGGSYEATYTIN